LINLKTVRASVDMQREVKEDKGREKARKKKSRRLKIFRIYEIQFQYFIFLYLNITLLHKYLTLGHITSRINILMNKIEKKIKRMEK